MGRPTTGVRLLTATRDISPPLAVLLSMAADTARPIPPQLVAHDPELPSRGQAHSNSWHLAASCGQLGRSRSNS